jgi:rubrerythrin
MDDNGLYFDRAKFDAVWDRVSGNNPGTGLSPEQTMKLKGADDRAQLRKFMDDEAADAQFYCVLAAKTTGCMRRTLSNIAADERRHLKKLRTKYFILSGETYDPAPVCPVIYSVSDALRKRFEGETKGAAAYKAAAEETARKDLADTYLDFAADEARHAMEIERLIECMVG